VFQPSTFRPAAFRPSLFRPSLFRASVCTGGDCIPSVSIPSVSVPSVSVPSVHVPSRSLASRTLPEITSKCVGVLGNREGAVYNVCADVLFAFNRAAVRSAASGALRSVARSIERRYGGRRITVEGHTDARGDEAYNRRLSLRRAESVKAWLVGQGGIAASRITVRGFGEARPVASNTTGEGRARNRRVVVGILPR
jgi:outer membrane protein OmpA-like peptidoglycan-associated protein